MSKITVENVTHLFGAGTASALNVLEDINLELKSQSVNAIVGTSGCGKSTLLNMMAGMLRPSEGRIRLDEEEIKGTDRRRGMVFQQDAVFPWMTVAENISYGPRIRGAGKAECAEIEKKWIELVGLKGFESAWP